MKVGLLITTFDRPNYLKQSLWSLEHADLSRVNEICIWDDASTNLETKQIINDFEPTHGLLSIMGNENNCGIKVSLLRGYDYLWSLNCDIVINLDGDAVVRPDFANQLLDNYTDTTILTGFHCTTKNANGSDRHKIIGEHGGVYLKQSVGGINFCVDYFAYKQYVKDALCISGNWDHNSCINAGAVYCLKESVVQHIGFDSSMGHHEQPDIADDFYYWHLPDVTLLGVDNNQVRLNKAKDICTKWIKYGDTVALSPDIRSKEAYSHFIIKEAYKHVKTSHMLIFQHDGYVNNFMAWDNEWLQYDYIGAPWWYNDGMAVGNGGFSLRSTRLMKIVATDKYISNCKLYHPEDDVICRTHREYLETKYHIKFAPIEVAERFSFEGYRQPKKVLADQFGVHGPNPRTKPATPRSENYIVNQFQGLGDILFLVPLIRALMDEGNNVTWPIADHYFNIAEHFPDIDMRRKSEVNVPYESRILTPTPFGKLLPYRFASELMGRDLRKCMQSKYEMYGHDWRMWRELTYKRDYQKEQLLISYLNLYEKSVFQLVNRYFGEAERGATIAPKPNPLLPIVEMRLIDGFSLIDWLGVVELAKEIHTANTSIMYLLELMELNKPVYVYKRHTWGEANFEHTSELWTNKKFIFEQ